MRASLTTRAVLTAAAAGLLILPTAPSAFATAGTYTVPVHQDLPVTAAGFGEHEAKCGSIGADQDGWHFVLPGNSTDFVKLTVSFDNGAPQVVSVFGPPTSKHAYVGSAPGAKLTSASAEVMGGEVKWFNLSHTCPAVRTTASPTPSTSAPSASTTPSASTSPSVSTSPGATTTASVSASPTGKASSGPTATVAPSTGSTSGVTAGESPSPSLSASPSGSVAASGSDRLASTGANVGLTLLAAVVLVGAGSVLVMRRRKAGRH
ncbi:LPXTG cell wall anchor domain-containing protein [Kitasatospora sp. NBC_01246]|uniref:LPXTG cell wall anchor domain-containing protein n=1 Tax=Kitasatospora sp. NBC_01246 TaxID=2903570 RepID=UPI002E3312A7|nr:LPXTG cell wall anchor domain-containing protein [Kitasatospora sp. NBC_01246]